MCDDLVITDIPVSSFITGNTGSIGATRYISVELSHLEQTSHAPKPDPVVINQ